MYICKYVQSHVSISHQRVSGTAMTVVRVSYYSNTISIQIIVKKICDEAYWCYVIFIGALCGHKISTYIFVKIQ